MGNASSVAEGAIFKVDKSLDDEGHYFGKYGIV